MNTCQFCLQEKPDAQPLDVSFAVIVIYDACIEHTYDAASKRVARIRAEREVWND